MEYFTVRLFNTPMGYIESEAFARRFALETFAFDLGDYVFRGTESNCRRLFECEELVDRKTCLPHDGAKMIIERDMAHSLDFLTLNPEQVRARFKRAYGGDLTVARLSLVPTSHGYHKGILIASLFTLSRASWWLANTPETTIDFKSVKHHL